MKNRFWYLYKIKNKNARISDKAIIEGRVEMDKDGVIEIGEKTRIRKWSCFKPYGGKIKIGKNCSINSFCHFSGNGNISIEDNVLIAAQCVLVSANHNFESIEQPLCFQGETRAPIVIEDNCWLGAGVKVLAGVTIGHDSVIGAGAVVNKDIPPFSVAVGVPAKVLYDRRTKTDEK